MNSLLRELVPVPKVGRRFEHQNVSRPPRERAALRPPCDPPFSTEAEASGEPNGSSKPFANSRMTQREKQRRAKEWQHNGDDAAVISGGSNHQETS
ncbi:hypothetical protein NL676_001968 [Syzygium grande]|nr:hypothetical protein NL676_001968 [Syzygium grande]